jgi:hypothetical protein
MKKNLLLSAMVMAVMFTAAGCTDFAVKQNDTVQNTTGTLLQGMGVGVGLADAQAVQLVLDNLNTTRSWRSIYGSDITVTPSPAFYEVTTKRWCRHVLIAVNAQSNRFDVYRTDKGWVRNNPAKKS